MNRAVIWALALALLGACGGGSGNALPDGGTDADTDTDTDTDTDADTDADADADADADSDSDSDSESGTGDCVDQDSDWWCVPFDCDDGDPDVNPGEDEVPGNEIDDDCDGLTDEAPAPDLLPELWYSADDLLVWVSIDPADGSVAEIVSSSMPGLEVGQNSVTMLADGSLFGARLSNTDFLTRFWYVADPPRDGSAIVPVELGTMPESIMLEAVYTDCDGRLYGMDTGTHVSTTEGNRLLRFTGDYLSGEFDYAVVSDWSQGDVPDIDDMGPGIGDEGQITDNPGFAIDSGNVYLFDYGLGNGTLAGPGGTWGIHALGGELFDDGVPRLYLLDSTAQLFEMDPETYAVSGVLGTGPAVANGLPGWSGLSGPLTDCISGFVE